MGLNSAVFHHQFRRKAPWRVDWWLVRETEPVGVVAKGTAWTKRGAWKASIDALDHFLVGSTELLDRCPCGLAFDMDYGTVGHREWCPHRHDLPPSVFDSDISGLGWR